MFTRQRVAVFIDGCFWHGCPEHGTSPTTNQSYWLPKIANNKHRDERHSSVLREAGWLAVRIWEHEEPSAAVERIVRAVESRNA